MYKEINEEDWIETYKPIVNHITPYASFSGYLFETYGDELEYVSSKDANNIWTVVEGDEGYPLIVSGYSLVNRIGYILTEVPWADEDMITIPLIDDEDEEYLVFPALEEGI